MRCFIIGNGPSRAGIDLTTLDGTTYGCNALYRDFSPDYLIAVDQKMQEEILASGYGGQCIFRKHKGLTIPETLMPNGEPQFIISEYDAVNNSGIIAFYYAMKHRHLEYITLGMDFTGENVYAGTPNYERHKLRPPKVRRDVLDTWKHWVDKNKHLITVQNYEQYVKESLNNEYIQSQQA
jgi:hypothetical protein